MIQAISSDRSWRQNGLALALLGALVVWPSAALAQSNTLTLEQAQAALLTAPDWRLADLNYANAQRALELAQAATGVQLSGGASYNLNPASSSAASTATQTLSASASMFVTVLPWSSAFDAVRKASRALERAALEQRDARNTLYLNAVNQYFAARTALLDLELARANEALSQSQLAVARSRQAAGQITKETLLGAEQNLESARASRQSAQNALELARLTLYQTLGLSSDAILSSAPGEVSLPAAGLEALVQSALSRRSDVLQAASSVADAEDTVVSAQRDRWLPNASVSADYGSQATGSVGVGLNLQSGAASLSGSYPIAQATTSTTSSPAWSVSASLNIPILTPSGDAKVRSAQTALEVARAALGSARRAAELDVRGKYHDARTALAKLTVARAAQTTATQALETARARLTAGSGTALEVESARIAKPQSDRDLESARATAQVAALRLEHALGTLQTPGGV